MVVILLLVTVLSLVVVLVVLVEVVGPYLVLVVKESVGLVQVSFQVISLVIVVLLVTIQVRVLVAVGWQQCLLHSVELCRLSNLLGFQFLG